MLCVVGWVCAIGFCIAFTAMWFRCHRADPDRLLRAIDDATRARRTARAQADTHQRMMQEFRDHVRTILRTRSERRKHAMLEAFCRRVIGKGG